MRRALAAAATALVLASTGCASDQAPEIAPPDAGGTATTSRRLGPCPPGGPDSTTPPAGCLDEEGVVQRP